MTLIGLAGNPNTGKSTLFNALTGSRQQVGNWPGKTVAKKEGLIPLGDGELVLVDLPGTYSLTAFSLEETIARDFIIDERPSAVACVLDATNLERNLYLALQVMETGVPVVLALNMMDVATRRGIRIDTTALSAQLGGISVIQTIGSRAIGIDTFKAAILETIQRSERPDLDHQFDSVLETEIVVLERSVEKIPVFASYNRRWVVIKLLEGDPATLEKSPAELREAVVAASARILEQTGEDPDTLIADARYTLISQIVQKAMTRPPHEVRTASDQIDRFLTHPVLGVPIFLLFMWVIFQLTANVSAPTVDFVDAVIGGPITTWVRSLLGIIGLSGSWVESLLTRGAVAGVGGVLVFVPVLLMLYFAMALLEDTGYMARAAFVMDRLMSRLGLHGKSFLPLLIGFGCNVPAIYATRTLENEQDRKITAFLVSFMSCGARLPIYVLFGTAFFGASSGTLIFFMYVLGLAVAVLTSLLLTRVIFRGKPIPPFVMELPPYRMPNVKTVWRSMQERTARFVRSAGTIILAASIVIWFLLAIPNRRGVGEFAAVKPDNSLFGGLSGLIAPVLAPAGFGDWRASGALVTGFLAKEVIVSSMTLVYTGEQAESPKPITTTFLEDVQSIGVALWQTVILTGQEIINIVPRTVNLLPGAAMPEADLLGQAQKNDETTALQTLLKATFTPLSAVAFCVFVLLYVPCMSAAGAIRSEFGTHWMALQMVYALGVAWLAATIVFQVGRLLGLGG